MEFKNIKDLFMNKYIYKGKAIYASSKKEALSEIVATIKQQKVLGSATADIKTWIQTTFAGVLGNLVNSDTEKNIFDSYADQLASVLNKFYTWNDSTKRYILNIKFNEADLPIVAIKKLKSFEELDKFVNKFYSDDVMESSYGCSTELVKIINAHFTKSDIKITPSSIRNIKSELIVRLNENLDINYPIENLLNEKFTCNVYVPLMEPSVMNGVFGTQSLATIVKDFVNKKLPKNIYEALRLCLINKSRNIDLSDFETVLLVLSRIMSELKVYYLDKLTLKQIISTYDSDNNLAIKQLQFNDKYAPKLMYDYPKAVTYPIDIKGDVSVNTEIVNAKILI